MIEATPHFPKKPLNVPRNLAKPTLRYRFHAWLAFCGLLLFVLFYLLLSVWFGWAAWRNLEIGFSPSGDLAFVIKGICAAVLAIFMVKGLFFRQRAASSQEFEITRKEQPGLFDYIYRVADEAGAPRPHKIYLSERVNACVFYDLSLLNFIFPTRKNLEIGLSLVNVLTLSEFKAILAHEFGHFAQRSMAVGRWVYTAQQIANQLIYHRDALDKLLSFISSIDLRVAWIGWVLRLIVWSIRSILDTMLHFVVLAERALSREMEFQADLVAVATTGSDALIHALHRLGGADQAWSETLDLMHQRLKNGHATEDAFEVHSRVLDHQRRILNDPAFGAIPPLPEIHPEAHRVFKADFAQPPQMWSTHPQSYLREENAKRCYIPAELNNNSAWDIFANPEQVRRAMTGILFQDIDLPVEPLADTCAAVDKHFSREFFKPQYHGVYLKRSVVRYAKNVDALYYRDGHVARDELYRDSLSEDLEQLWDLSKEVGLLTELKQGTFKSPDGQIRFRGDVISRRKLGPAIAHVKVDLDQCEARLQLHDSKCRTYFYHQASRVSKEWADYLHKLLIALHYAEHTWRDLLDVDQKLQNTFAVVIADGSVSQSELKRLLADANSAYRAMAEIYNAQSVVFLDKTVEDKLGGQPWDKRWEALRLPAPDPDNIQEWLQVYPDWMNCAIQNMADLRVALLEQLLASEAQVEQLAQLKATSMNPVRVPAPSAPRVPLNYATLAPGEERKLQTKLGIWDSFQTATGFFPGLVRFCVSSVIVLCALYTTLPPDWLQKLYEAGWLAFLPF